MGLLDEAKSKLKEAYRLTTLEDVPEQVAEPLYQEAERLLQQASAVQASAEAHLTYARLLRDRRRYEEAVVQFQQAQRLAPTDQQIRFEYAELQQHLGQPDDSYPPETEATEPSSFEAGYPPETEATESSSFEAGYYPETEAAESPSFEAGYYPETEAAESPSLKADYHWALGCYLQDEKSDLSGAETAFQAALAHNPHYQPALESYSLLLLKQNRYDQAEGYLANLAKAEFLYVEDFFTKLPPEIRPNSDLLALRARLYLRQGRQKEAEPLLRQAVEDSPEQIEWLATYVQLLSDLNQPEAAIKRLRQAFAQKLEAAALHREYARLMVRQRRFDEVDLHLKQALELAPQDPETLNLQDELHRRLTAYQEARGWMALAIMRAKQGLTTEARNLFEKALNIDPEHLPALKAYANFLEEQHDYAEVEQIWAIVATVAPQEAEAYYQTLLQTRGESPETLNSLARLQIQLDRPAEAEIHLRRSLAFRSNQLETLQLLVEVLYQQHRLLEAETLLCQHSDALSTQPKLSLRYAQLMAARYNYSKAEEYYDKAQKLDPDDQEIAQAYRADTERIHRYKQAELEMAWGHHLEVQGNHAEAEQTYKQALTIDPNHVPTLKHYASLLENIGRPVEAGQLLNQLAQLDPIEAEAHYRTRPLLLENNLESQCAYALLLQNLDRPVEAMERFSLVLAAQPAYLPALIPYVNALLEQDQIKAAEAALKLALNQDDLTPDIHWSYAKLLANYRHRFDLARLHLERVERLTGADLDDYAQLQAKLEQFDEADKEFALAQYMTDLNPLEAVTHFEKAYNLCSDQPVILINYARFLRQQGQPAQAQRYLEEALKLDPYDEEAAQLLQALTAPAGEVTQPVLPLADDSGGHVVAEEGLAQPVSVELTLPVPELIEEKLTDE